MSMMKTEPTIIYCHGYASSPNTDKVTELRKHFKEVLAWQIDVDPDKSLPYLEEEIDQYLAGHINEEGPLVFVGTSLGAWYAGYLAKLYHAPAVLINPCYSFDAVKVDLGIPEEIKAKYEAIGFQYPERTTFFVAVNDEVIDMQAFAPESTTYHKMRTNTTADHRFNGEPFENVIEYIKSEDI